jgi:hypothetical protein
MSTPEDYSSQPAQPQYPAPSYGAGPQYEPPTSPMQPQSPAYPPPPPPSYGGAPTPPQSPGQPYPSQPYQTQPTQGQPYQSQPTQGQPYQEQPYQGQPNQGQPYQGQPYQGQPQGQPYPGQPYPPPAAPYPPPPAGAYPPPGGAYPPPPGQFPVATPPPPKKRGPLAAIGGVAVIIVIAVAAFVVRAALHTGANALLDNGSSAAAPKTPFEATPADAFPRGEAGIVVPAATDVPGFAKDDVAKALDSVKKALVAGRLDPKMLTGHDTSTFMGLFAPAMKPDLQTYFDKKEFLPFATQIAPNFKLTSDPVRVKGEMTFEGTTTDGLRVIQVVTNFVWVYPFTGDLKDPGDHLVTIHDKITWLFPHPEDVVDEAIGMNMSEWEAFASNMDCGLFDQSLIGLGKPRLTVGGASDDPNAAFDPNGTLNVTDTC